MTAILCVQSVQTQLEMAFLRLFQHTLKEHTPSNLYQQAFLAGIPFIVGGKAGGLPVWGVRYRGVARNFLGALSAHRFVFWVYGEVCHFRCGTGGFVPTWSNATGDGGDV